MIMMSYRDPTWGLKVKRTEAQCSSLINEIYAHLQELRPRNVDSEWAKMLRGSELSEEIAIARIKWSSLLNPKQRMQCVEPAG